MVTKETMVLRKNNSKLTFSASGFRLSKRRNCGRIKMELRYYAMGIFFVLEFSGFPNSSYFGKGCKLPFAAQN